MEYESEIPTPGRIVIVRSLVHKLEWNPYITPAFVVRADPPVITAWLPTGIEVATYLPPLPLDAVLVGHGPMHADTDTIAGSADRAREVLHAVLIERGATHVWYWPPRETPKHFRIEVTGGGIYRLVP